MSRSLGLSNVRPVVIPSGVYYENIDDYKCLYSVYCIPAPIRAQIKERMQSNYCLYVLVYSKK